MNTKRLAMGFYLIMGCIAIISCTRLTKSELAKDQSYRTPIPESTILAYRQGTPIADRMQAVIAARAEVLGGKIESMGTPEVLFSERMTLAEAKKKSAHPGEVSYEDIPLNTPVWFVILKGVWQLDPPPLASRVTATPYPPIHGCMYVWFPANLNKYRSIGSIDCGNH